MPRLNKTATTVRRAVRQTNHKTAALPASIPACRAAIDSIDEKVVALLEQRAQLACKIGEHKKAAVKEPAAKKSTTAAAKKSGAKSAPAIYIPEREAQVLAKAAARSELLKPHIHGIYRLIISACLSLEKPLRVAFLGPHGTFSHEAALSLFGDSMQALPAHTITASLRETEKGNADIAIVPFENSGSGAVGETRDALPETSLQINGEFYLRIQHHLLVAARHGKVGAGDLKTIYGHPQAFSQCRRWLAAHAPQAHLEAVTSSAAAAILASENSKKAVATIGSSFSQVLYNLQPLAKNIEDFSHNSTRFFIFGKRDLQPSGCDKTSLLMTTKHESGALCKILQSFSRYGVNMTKLESVPSSGKLWEYLFYIDLDGHQQDEAVRKALAAIKKHAPFLKILGSYPQAAKA